MVSTGRRVRKERNPAGSPKSMFASKSNPTNHPDKVAVTAFRYIPLLPFTLHAKNSITKTNAANSKITNTNPSIFPVSLSDSGFSPSALRCVSCTLHTALTAAKGRFQPLNVGSVCCPDSGRTDGDSGPGYTGRSPCLFIPACSLTHI